MTVEGGEEVRGACEEMDRDGHDVGVDVVELVLVEVVPDAGRVAEQVLDGHGRVDERQLVGEEAAQRGIGAELAGFDERRHGERGQALGRARSAEPRVERVRPLIGAVGEAARDLDEALIAPRHRDDPREPVLVGQRLQFVLQGRRHRHPPSTRTAAELEPGCVRRRTAPPNRRSSG